MTGMSEENMFIQYEILEPQLRLSLLVRRHNLLGKEPKLNLEMIESTERKYVRHF